MSLGIGNHRGIIPPTSSGAPLYAGGGGQAPPSASSGQASAGLRAGLLTARLAEWRCPRENC